MTIKISVIIFLNYIAICYLFWDLVEFAPRDLSSSDGLVRRVQLIWCRCMVFWKALYYSLTLSKFRTVLLCSFWENGGNVFQFCCFTMCGPKTTCYFIFYFCCVCVITISKKEIETRSKMCVLFSTIGSVSRTTEFVVTDECCCRKLGGFVTFYSFYWIDDLLFGGINCGF